MNQQKSAKPSVLSQEDRLLWKRVSDTVTPLSKVALAPPKQEFLKEEMNRLMAHTSASVRLNQQGHYGAYSAKNPSLQAHAPASHVAQNQHHPIEKRVIQKLTKGRQAIDSRIDLHGYTQDRARAALLTFLQEAQQQDHRIVLVITGKGSGGQGVLRSYVPQWLHLQPFTALVNGFQTSHVSHGGEGALYVRIRKKQARVKRGRHDPFR